VSLLWGIVFLFLSFSAYAGPVKEGSSVYTVQVASFKSKEEAVNFAARLKEKFPSIRVIPYRGTYRVRIGLFKSYREALEFTKSPQFRESFKDYFIAKTRYVPGREVKLPEPVELPPPQSLAEVVDFQPSTLNDESQISRGKGEGSSGIESKEESAKEIKAIEGADELSSRSSLPEGQGREVSENATESESPLLKEQRSGCGTGAPPESTLENRQEGAPPKGEAEFGGLKPSDENATGEERLSEGKAAEPHTPEAVPEEKEAGGFNLLYLLMPLALLFALYLFRSFRGEEDGSYLEAYVARLLEEGKYEEVVEVALPFAKKNPKNTFIKGALAESYEALGRFLEAAEAYSEVAEELERRGLKELAEEVRRKAEELYGREFKK
jgi:hypothetical protein